MGQESDGSSRGQRGLPTPPLCALGCLNTAPFMYVHVCIIIYNVCRSVDCVFIWTYRHVLAMFECESYAGILYQTSLI